MISFSMFIFLISIKQLFSLISHFVNIYLLNLSLDQKGAFRTNIHTSCSLVLPYHISAYY